LNVQVIDNKGNQQHQQQLLNVFGSTVGNDMYALMPDQSPPSLYDADMAMPGVFGDASFFSETFEWDLANIWTSDFTNFMQDQHGHP